jgi:uncharacterized protein (DUF2062 family)
MTRIFPDQRPEGADAAACSKRQDSVPGWIGRLAGISDTPRRTAAAFALGVFLSFSPLFGLQIAIGLGAVLLLRLNRLAVVLGLCSNLPWLMVPWYALATAVGAAILGVPIASDISTRLQRVFDLSMYTREFWTRLLDLLWPFLGAFILGSTVGAAVLGAVAYIATLRLVTRVKAARASF